MENRAHALIAGLFLLLLGSAVAVAVWWFTDLQEANNPYLLYTRGNVTGLNVEAQVRYRGIQAGRVQAIRIDPQDPQNILVDILLRSDLQVTEGTTARIGYQGVTGLGFVLLEDEGLQPAPLRSSDGLPPRIELRPGLFDEVTDIATKTALRFQAVADDIAAIFSPHNRERIETTLARLESAAAGMEETFAAAPEVLAAIHATLSPQNLAHFESLLRNLDRAGAQAEPLAAEFRTLVTRLDTLGSQLETQVQQAGEQFSQHTLPQIDTLLLDLGATAQRIERFVAEVDEQPQMFLHGRSTVPAGPGEAGFRP